MDEMDVEAFVVPQVRAMRGYAGTPSVPQIARKLGLREDEVIKLDANENPFAPSQAVLDAIARAAPNLYPDPDQNELRDALAKFLGVSRDLIIAGNGGDEIIHMIFRLLINAGDTVIDTPPTFGVYAAEATQAQAKYITAARRVDFSLDLPAIQNAVKANPQAKLLVLCNPNNPTANSTSHEDILRLIELPLMVLVDEAYIELSAQPSVAKLVQQHDNVIVLRTLSKLAGLAGLRCGYGIFPRKIAGHALKIKPYFTPGIAAQAAGVAVLNDPDTLLRNKRAIVAERARLCEMLDELGWVKPLPSETNFVLCELIPKSDTSALLGAHVVQYLAEKGILIRHFGGALERYIRISIGLPKQHDRLVAALREFRI